jgi:spermidine synthase
MVDLDKVVVDVSREHLPEWGAGCWDDPRLEMHYTDAHAWLMQYKGPKFDVIIMDIADPIEAGPGYVLYTV